MLLPLGAEGTKGFESYSISETQDKYIYDAFLMIYLSILLLFCFFSLFGTSKELIRDSQRLSFCSFVGLQEKSQDNISKQAAVEKEPLTLEKDKEDQSHLFYI